MIYGNKSVRPESVGKIFRGDKHRRPVDIITIRAIKGLIWGFYSPSPWTVWIRVAALPYGIEVTRFGYLTWWKRYEVRVLRVTP
jgi:hypothetical protein